MNIQRKYTFNTGDRVYARLMRNGTQVIEFFVESARDIRDIIDVVRRSVDRGLGLTRLYVRNLSQGWSGERSLLIR